MARTGQLNKATLNALAGGGLAVEGAVRLIVLLLAMEFVVDECKPAPVRKHTSALQPLVIRVAPGSRVVDCHVRCVHTVVGPRHARQGRSNGSEGAVGRRDEIAPVSQWVVPRKGHRIRLFARHVPVQPVNPLGVWAGVTALVPNHFGRADRREHRP